MFSDKKIQEEILSKISTTNRAILKTDREKANYGVNILNALVDEISKESVSSTDPVVQGSECISPAASTVGHREPCRDLIDFATEIVKLLRGFQVANLDKLILRMCNRCYSEELFSLVEDRTEPEHAAAMCIIKFRHLGVYDHDIRRIYKDLGGSIKRVVESVFGVLLDGKCCSSENEPLQSSSCMHVSFQRPEALCTGHAGEDSRATGDTVQIAYKTFITRLSRGVCETEYFDLPQIWNEYEVFKNNFRKIKHRVVNELRAKFDGSTGSCVAAKHNERCTKRRAKPGPSDIGECHDRIVVARANDCLNLFNSGIDFLRRNRLGIAKKCFTDILASGLVLELTYHILALIHFFQLEYFEAAYYIRLGIKYSHARKCGNSDHFVNLLLFVERFGSFSGTFPNIGLNVFKRSLNIDQIICFRDAGVVGPSKAHPDTLGDSACEDQARLMSSDTALYRMFENKFLISLVLKASTFYSQVAGFAQFKTRLQFQAMLKQIRLKYSSYSVLAAYTYDSRLFVNDLEHTTEVIPDWGAIKAKYDGIMSRNSAVLKTMASSRADWWENRSMLDKELENLVSIVKGAFRRSFPALKDRIILILDGSINAFPFEAIFRNKAVSRVLSLEYLFHCSPSQSSTAPTLDSFLCGRVNSNRLVGGDSNRLVDGDSIFYLLDPECNLDRTRSRISTYLRRRGVSNGIAGRGLNDTERAALSRYDILMYFGHGSGKKHFDVCTPKPSKIFLFGCSSVRMLHTPNYRPNGLVAQKLRGERSSKIIVGNLWDVTDKDLDSLTEGFLDDNLAIPPSFGYRMERYREMCRLRYLNGTAFVIYGIL